VLESPRKWSKANPDYWKKYRQKHPEQVERNRRQQRLRDTKRRLVNLANNNLATWQVLIFHSHDHSGSVSSASCKQHPLVKPLPLVYELPMLSEFFASCARIQALRDGPAGSLLESFAQALWRQDTSGG
jgi:hypothetical protein